MHCIYFHPNNARPTTWPSPFLPFLAYLITDTIGGQHEIHFSIEPFGGLLSYLLLSVNYIACCRLLYHRHDRYLLFQFQKLRASIPSPSPLVPPLLVHSSNKTIRGLSRGFSETRDTIAKFPLVSPLERNCTSERGWGKG